MFDLVLTIFELAVFPLLLAAVGGYLAAKVLEDRKERRLFIGVFVLLFLGGLAVSVVRETRVYTQDKKRELRMDDMYGQLRIAVQNVVNPPANSEHKQIADALVTIQNKMSIAITKPVPQVAADTTLAGMSNAALREYSIRLAREMRDYEASYMAQDFAMEMRVPPIASTDAAERQRIQTERFAETLRKAMDHQSEYKNKFWADALAAYQEIIKRLEHAGIKIPDVSASAKFLPPVAGGELVKDTLASGALHGPMPITGAADYLELLARTLPR